VEVDFGSAAKKAVAVVEASTDYGACDVLGFIFGTKFYIK